MKTHIEFDNDVERKEFFIKVCNDIIANLEIAKKGYTGDLGDIANEVGRAVGHNTCKDQKDQNIWGFEKDDFINGFNHGYSLQDGTH